MKNTVLIIAVAALLVLTAWTAAYAASFTFNLRDFTIEDVNGLTLAEARFYFLTANPVPKELSDPNDPKSIMVQTMTDTQWFIIKTRGAVNDYWVKQVSRGREKIKATKRIRKVIKDE